MRLVIISDTHGRHGELGTLSGDVLIHCGDFCDGFNNDGSLVADIDQWFSRQHFKRILCIGGNHDFAAQERRTRGSIVFDHAIYLQDEVYDFEGLRFYGSPWLPDLEGWAYYLSDNERKAKWEQIPSDTDVLITHTPPYGILDRPRSGRHIGCSFLRSTVAGIRPRLHCFGHVHASPGKAVESSTIFVNASMVDSQYLIRNSPIVIDL